MRKDAKVYFVAFVIQLAAFFMLFTFLSRTARSAPLCDVSPTTTPIVVPAAKPVEWCWGAAANAPGWPRYWIVHVRVRGAVDQYHVIKGRPCWAPLLTPGGYEVRVIAVYDTPLKSPWSEWSRPAEVQ